MSPVRAKLTVCSAERRPRRDTTRSENAKILSVRSGTARAAGDHPEHDRTEISDPSLRQAGVVIVVAQIPGSDQACVLLTKRPEHMRRHAGQFALPGGRLDAGETIREAALRELREELRLQLDEGDILGQLDDLPTRSGFRITPIVAWGGPSLELDPDPEEVARVYRIPLTELDSPAIPI